MKKLMLVLAMLCCLLPAAVMAEVELTVIPYELGFEYVFRLEDSWARVCWSGPDASGSKALYAPDGFFAGVIELPFAEAGGKYTVSIESLSLRTLARTKVEIPATAAYQAETGVTNVNVRQLELTETTTGFRYSFLAPGSDYMLLYFRSKQEEACFPVYPINEDGLYEGEVISDLTLPRTLFKVEIRNRNNGVKASGEVRKGFEVPVEAELLPGRLSGLVVCIDPGHQEERRYYTEPLGPGLSGNAQISGSVAQGKVTMRKESIVALEMAFILRDALLREGAQVVMTRTTQEEFLTNVERCQMAEEAGADLMLHLHCEPEGNSKNSGVNVYIPRDSEYAKAVADEEAYGLMAQLLLDEIKEAAGYELTEKTGRVYSNNQHVENNWAKMPSFLITMGYLSNPADDIRLATPEYQETLCQGIVEGVYQVALQRGLVAE